ncbi:helix-turn-helix domain-containing protein [Arthrobacter sp. Soil782]|uniref:helix-turn-helix domain-containing protein n=1 Tax=Arthrobacter sp. Soil782 TaxID=1736410 RepID=UPI00191000C7|nr:helix-turn-helix domain-containing protein [Arthrobacter sp. Soil782]
MNIYTRSGYDRYMEHPDTTPFFRAVDAASLGRSISEARKEAGMTQRELAARLGVGRGTVVRLENGEAVSVVVAMHAIRIIGRDVALVPRFSRLQVKK